MLTKSGFDSNVEAAFLQLLYVSYETILKLLEVFNVLSWFLRAGIN